MSEPGSNSSPFGFSDAGSLVDQVMALFNGTDLPSRVQVEETVDGFLRLPVARHLADRRVWIIDEVLRRTDVSIDPANVLENNDLHEPWLEGLDQDDWRLWRRLKTHLQFEEGIPPQVVGELDASTTKTLARLESPRREGKWDRRGMVVGHVQSGKTTHYTALAAKALDAGYRIVVVLAGMHNNLRSQTHGRIDRDLTGRNSRAAQTGTEQWASIGVQELQRKRGWDAPAFTIQTCTTAEENGDFRSNQSRSVYLEVGEGTRLVMVVKKNASVLRKLRDWFRGLLTDGAGGGGQLIPHPVLFIDDEADQASINTRDEDEDPSTINRLIRELLTSFNRVGFVAYTATPFANVFAEPDTDEDDLARYGPDLFPKIFHRQPAGADELHRPRASVRQPRRRPGGTGRARAAADARRGRRRRRLDSAEAQVRPRRRAAARLAGGGDPPVRARLRRPLLPGRREGSTTRCSSTSRAS